jgi:hypothetical protein
MIKTDFWVYLDDDDDDDNDDDDDCQRHRFFLGSTAVPLLISSLSYIPAGTLVVWTFK